jgi:3-hydroxymyristoyl/3-hydroxydecanoyl-(acyl carrier protein) dehydratase
MTSLPHAPPFRLIDRVVSVDIAAATLVAERRITANCALWPAESAASHPGPLVLSFPDVLVIEALCQAAACLNVLDAAPDAARHHLGYLVAISNFRFQPNCQDLESAPICRPTVGDTLILKVKRQSRMGAIVAFSAEAHVQIAPDPTLHELAAGQLMFAIG